MSAPRVGESLSGDRRERPRPSGDTCSLIVSRLPGTLVGVKASEVLRIDYHYTGVKTRADDRAASEPTIDLCQLLGGRWPDEAGGRCTMLVWSGVSRLRLLAGTTARVVAVAKGQLSPLPALLAGLRSRAAVSALVLADGRLGVVVDNNLLGRFVERTSADEVTRR